MQDPVINLKFFKNSKIIITLALSFVTGITMMGMIFVPQFSENALRIASGRGGYFVFILGLFAGLGAPTSGKLIDRFGVKIVLGFGYVASIIGALYLIFVTTSFPTPANVVISLVLTGIGMGFTMGTPLNYMMLDNTKKEESNSALATLSLIRSIGTTVAPAIMIGFIAHAGINVQSNVMNLMPKEVSIPALPYAQELKDEFPNSGMSDLTSMQTVKIDMNAATGSTLDAGLLDLMKASDVTTITQNAKTLAASMFAEMSPKILAQTTEGIDGAIAGVTEGMTKIDAQIAAMRKIPARGDSGPAAAAIGKMKAAKDHMSETIRKMAVMKGRRPPDRSRLRSRIISRRLTRNNRRSKRHFRIR